MPLVFAYGSNMDRAAMAQRCPSSTALGKARLARHRFAILPQGYASVVPDIRATVYGVLWDVKFADMLSLDRYENVAAGLYKKVVSSILKAGGGTACAIVYIGKGEGGRPPLPYMENIIAAAREWELPAAHIRELERFLPIRPGGPVPAKPH